MSYTVEAVLPADSPSSSGQAQVEQLQKVESELLSTREELRVFEETYREVRDFCLYISVCISDPLPNMVMVIRLPLPESSLTLQCTGPPST